MNAKKRYPSRLQAQFLWLLVTLFATTFVYAQNSNDSIVIDTLASGEPVYNCMKVDQSQSFRKEFQLYVRIICVFITRVISTMMKV